MTTLLFHSNKNYLSRFGREHILVGYYTKYYLAEADVRFIAIYDQVDSEKNPDDDITPFKNILNEMYAKDCSKKIKAVFKVNRQTAREKAWHYATPDSELCAFT